ncbi:DUF4129 domain-containing protein [Paenibacillus sp. OSY-SE]|uniref:DUF4129 domain-containing protein n=1 Tax=Paenibacillus sp. OSY-SE TaxID=1196323 RepID=UPI0002F28319|nr:DUF4129 domain-containing protein [Paenibacillus sp. OSY-SE]
MPDKSKWISDGCRGLLEYVLAFPIVFLLTVYLLPEQAGASFWYGILPLFALLGVMAKKIFRWKRDNLWLMLVLVIGGVLYAASGPIDIPRIVSLVMCFVLFGRGVKIVSELDLWMDTVHWNGIALAVYFIVYIVSIYRPEMMPFQDHLVGAGIIAIVVTLFQMNWSQLRKANLSAGSGDAGGVRSSVPAQVSHINAWYAGSFFVFVMMAVALTFGSAMDTLMNWTRALLGWLFRSSPPTDAVPDIPPSMPEPPPLLGLGKAKEPSAFVQLLERIAIVAVWCALAVAIIAGFIYLFRFAVKKWFPKLWQWLLQFFSQKGETPSEVGYIDEQTSMFQWEKLRRNVMQPWNKAMRRWGRPHAKYSELKTNRERVRYLYRDQLQRSEAKGYEHRSYLTPKETVQEIGRQDRAANTSVLTELGEAYNEARYGEKEIADDKVERLYAHSKQERK